VAGERRLLREQLQKEDLVQTFDRRNFRITQAGVDHILSLPTDDEVDRRFQRASAIIPMVQRPFGILKATDPVGPKSYYFGPVMARGLKEHWLCVVTRPLAADPQNEASIDVEELTTWFIMKGEDYILGQEATLADSRRI